ncbi:MAG: hypothetical protein E7017_03660 [Alphaproteobacteria bacterium]|nr:hypothetical protein [Alphaproteobacteria bacterium]
MRNLFNILILLLTGIFFVVRTDAYAQDVLTDDPTETNSKFSDWVNKQKHNFEETKEQLGQSQLATTIGKGVEAGKKGINFVKDTIGDVKQFVEDVQQSDEYKIAMLSKQIAEKTKELADLEKKREEEISALKDDAELTRVTLQEKISQAEENIQTMSEISLSDAEEPQNIEDFVDVSEFDITALKAELEAIDSNLEDDIKAVSISYAEEIYAKGEEIADLTREMEELISKNDRKQDKASKDPEAVITEAKDSFSFDNNDNIITLDDRKNKEKKRTKKLSSVVMASQNMSSSYINTSQNKKEQQELVAFSATTQLGSSDVLQPAIEDTVNQLDDVYNYLLTELKTLEAQSAFYLAANKNYKADKAKASIDMCNYSDVKKKSLFSGVKSAYDKLKKRVDKLTDTAGEVISGVQDLKEKGNDLKNIADDVSGKVSGRTGMQ